ncbi:unknown [Paraprevotella clara CAG:116]|nr:unknown [Paraprevotella clara CAG:116]
MLSAQESGHTVNREMLSLRTEVPQTEIDGQPIIPGQFDLQPVQRRVVLAPQQSFFAQREIEVVFRLPLLQTELKRTDAMLFLRIPCRSAHFQLHTVPDVFGRGQPHFQPDRLFLRIRINLHTGQMQRFFRFQENVADDAIPIRLCGFRIGM